MINPEIKKASQSTFIYSTKAQNKALHILIHLDIRFQLLINHHAKAMKLQTGQSPIYETNRDHESVFKEKQLQLSSNDDISDTN